MSNSNEFREDSQSFKFKAPERLQVQRQHQLPAKGARILKKQACDSDQQPEEALEDDVEDEESNLGNIQHDLGSLMSANNILTEKSIDRREHIRGKTSAGCDEFSNNSSDSDRPAQVKVALNTNEATRQVVQPSENQTSSKAPSDELNQLAKATDQQDDSKRQAAIEATKSLTASTSTNANERGAQNVELGAENEKKASCLREARKGKRKRILDPSGSLYYHWSMVVSFAFLYNFWSLSYRFAFREIDFDTVAFWFTLDYSADFIYILDVIINFHTGYLEDGVLEQNIDKIGQYYRECTLFYLDCFCLLPLDILYLSIGFNSILRCTRLVKIYKFWSYIDRTERHTNYPNVFRTVTLVHYILVIFHWNACLFHMISKNKIIDIENLYRISNNRCDDILCQYLHAFYWSTLALTTIGDLPKPRTKGEYVYIIFELFFGLFLFASVLGHVANIVTNVSAARKEFQAKLDAVKTFMRIRRVSDDLQNKVIRWFDYLWISQKSSDDEKSVACLPDRLKAEIAIHVHLDTLKRVDIFQNTEAGFLCELVLRLKPVLFSPGDYVCRKNEVGHEMYIVSRGILEVVTDNGKSVVATLKAGSYFGEISVLNVGLAGNKRTASVRSVGYSDLFCLNKQDLWDVLKNYPNAEARIRARAEERLSKLDISKPLAGSGPAKVQMRAHQRRLMASKSTSSTGGGAPIHGSATRISKRVALDDHNPQCSAHLPLNSCCNKACQYDHHIMTALKQSPIFAGHEPNLGTGCGSCRWLSSQSQLVQKEDNLASHHQIHFHTKHNSSFENHCSKSFDQELEAKASVLSNHCDHDKIIQMPENSPSIRHQQFNHESFSFADSDLVCLKATRGRSRALDSNTKADHQINQTMATLAANQHIQSASSIDIVRKSQFNAPEAPPSGNCDGAKFLNIFSANGGRQQEQRQHQALKASYSLGACETTNSSSSGDRLRRSRKRRQHLYQQQQQHHYHEREQRLDCYNCSRNDRALADWSPHHSSTGLGRQQQRQSHKHAGEVQQMSQQQQRQPSTTGFWISAGDGHSPGAAPSIMPLLAAPTGDGQYRMLQPITLLATGDQSSTSGAVFQSVSMSHLNMMPAGTLVSNLNLAGPNLLGLVSGPDQARLMSKSAQSMTKPRGAGGPVEGEGRRAENVSSTSSSSAAAHGEPTTNDEFTPPPPQTRLNQAKQCDDNSHQQLDDANKTD